MREKLVNACAADIERLSDFARRQGWIKIHRECPFRLADVVGLKLREKNALPNDGRRSEGLTQNDVRREAFGIRGKKNGDYSGGREVVGEGGSGALKLRLR